MNLPIQQRQGPEGYLGWVGVETMRTKGIVRISQCSPSMGVCHVVKLGTSSGGLKAGICQPRGWGREDRFWRPVVWGVAGPNERQPRDHSLWLVTGDAWAATVLVRWCPGFPPALCSSNGFFKPLEERSLSTQWALSFCQGIGRGLVSGWSTGFSFYKGRAEAAAWSQWRMLILPAKVTRNSASGGLRHGQVKAEEQAAVCLVKNAFETNAVSPKCTGRQWSLKGKDQREGWILLLCGQGPPDHQSS